MNAAKPQRILLVASVSGRCSGAVPSTVTSQQDGHGFDYKCVVSMFSLCLQGFCPDTPTSCQSPKAQIGLTGELWLRQPVRLSLWGCDYASWDASSSPGKHRVERDGLDLYLQVVTHQLVHPNTAPCWKLTPLFFIALLSCLTTSIPSTPLALKRFVHVIRYPCRQRQPKPDHCYRS